MNGRSPPSAQPQGSALMGVPRLWALTGWVREATGGSCWLRQTTDTSTQGKIALTWPADPRPLREAPVACPVLRVRGREDGREPLLKDFWEDFSGGVCNGTLPQL